MGINIKRKLSIILVFILISSSFTVMATGLGSLGEYYNSVLEHNTYLYYNQITGEDAFYSLILPEDRVDSDNASIISQAESITAGCTTDMGKIQKVHDWVAKNLYYDYDYYNDKTTSTPIIASDVLKYKYTVCEGYANLTAALLRSLGIPTKLIRGYALTGQEEWTQANSSGSDMNHKWNMVYADGRWINLDVTWDSPNIKENNFLYDGGSISQQYFDLTLAELSVDHKIVQLDEGHTYYNLATGFKYCLSSDGSIEIIGLINEGAEMIIIPSLIGTRAVTSIGWEAFRDNHTLKTVIIGDRIKTIKTQAFLDCTSLESIYVPASVTQIDHCAIGYNYSSTPGYLTATRKITIYGTAGGAAESYAKDGKFYFKIGYFDITDAESRINIRGLSPDAASLTISAALTSDYDGLKDSLSASSLTAYRITLQNADAAAVTPNGTVEVSIPLPSGYDGKNTFIYAADSEGNLTPVTANIVNGYIVFTADDTLGDFIITSRIPSNILYGDVDGSGIADVVDARLILRAAVQLISFNEEQTVIADVDFNGVIDVTDARTVLRRAVGLE